MLNKAKTHFVHTITATTTSTTTAIISTSPNSPTITSTAISSALAKAKSISNTFRNGECGVELKQNALYTCQLSMGYINIVPVTPLGIKLKLPGLPILLLLLLLLLLQLLLPLPLL